MRVAIVFLVSFLFLSGCKITNPTFERMSDWKLEKLSADNIRISNVATFYNPNKVGGMKAGRINLSIMTKGKVIGHITSDQSHVKIPRESEFSIPLTFHVNPKDVIGSLSSVLDMAMGKQIELRCVGDVSVGYSIVHKKIKIDETVPVSLSNLK